MKIIVQPLPVPSQVADVSAGFDRWWARAASRDPAGRFQTAKEFAESLQMVFGASQATDVMDRAQLKAMLGQTPQPGGPHPLTPSGRPQPMAPGYQAGLSATTGAPIARTFADEGPPVAPKSKAGLVIGAAAVGIFVVASAIGIIALRGKGSATSNAPTAAAVAPLPQETAPPPPRGHRASGSDCGAETPAGGRGNRHGDGDRGARRDRGGNRERGSEGIAPLLRRGTEARGRPRAEARSRCGPTETGGRQDGERFGLLTRPAGAPN